MNEIIELAKKMGQLIKEDPIVKRLFAAKDEYEHDEKLNALLTEYNVQQQAITAEYAKAEQDKELIDMIENRLQTISDEVMNHPLFKKYGEAEKDYTDLMKMVNDEINFQITGKRACSGDCSACGGCSSQEK